MDPYFAALVVLSLLLSSSSLWQWKPRPKGLSPQDQPFPGPGKYLNFTTTRHQDFCRFRNRFLRVYALAVAADWLQGSFIYSLYRNTHKLSESSVASLFATGYLWGALSGGITGALADKYGRKLACITYCVIYSASCLTCLTHNLPLLFLGRALGGISTTLLSTVFETWMVAQFHQLGFESSDGLLSDILGSMSTINGAVAVACGIVSQALVSISGSEKMPFLVSTICLSAAGSIMWRSWPENYRQTDQARSDDTTHHVLTMLVICTVSSVVEGTMYIFVYFWSPAMIASRTEARSPHDPPLGLIFASFMCAMTLGSLAFSYVTRHENSISQMSESLQFILPSLAITLLVTLITDKEMCLFCAFCVFEFCLGFYYPCMAYLKGIIIDDNNRGKVYGLMRVPLGLFVLGSLASVKEDPYSREDRFIFCSFLLIACTLFMRHFVR